MFFQGGFTPTTLQGDNTTVPVPDPAFTDPGLPPNRPAPPDDYLHGMVWRALADGWLRGEQILKHDLIYAYNYADPNSWSAPSAMTWDFGQDVGTAALDCDQLIVRLDLRSPSAPVQPTDTRWDVAKWDDPVPPGAGWMASYQNWTDITDHVRGIRVTRGRTTSWDAIQSGEAQVEVDNSDGFFSLFSAQGYVRFQINTGIYIGALWRGIEYPLFVGGLIQFDEADTPDDNSAIFYALDGSQKLTDEQNAEYNPGVPGELAGARINRLLDRAKVTARRSIASGDATMTNYKTLRQYIDEINLTALSDGGLFFVDNDGTFMYQGRDRLNGRSSKIIPYFSDACKGDLPYASIELAWSDFEFGNVVTISNVSQGSNSNQSAMASDKVSIDKYGRVQWSPSQLVLTNATDLSALAQWELERRSEAFYRVNAFEVYPMHDDRLWRSMLNMRLGYPLIIERKPPSTAAPVIAEMLCDGMRIEGTPEVWKFTVFCSPATDIFGRRYGEGDYGEALYGSW